jgi:hypothetical protein
MTGGVEDLDAEVADEEHLSVINAHVDVVHRRRAVHHRGHGEPASERVRRGEVVGVRMCVHDILELDARAARLAKVDPTSVAPRRQDHDHGARRPAMSRGRRDNCPAFATRRRNASGADDVDRNCANDWGAARKMMASGAVRRGGPITRARRVTRAPPAALLILST